MATRAVDVHAEVIDFDHGHWCNRCMLPTGFRFWVAVTIDYWMQMQVRPWCYQCQSGCHVILDADHT